MSEQNPISPDRITASSDASAEWKSRMAEALANATPKQELEVPKEGTMFQSGDELLLKASSLPLGFGPVTTLDSKPEKQIAPTIYEQKIGIGLNIKRAREQVTGVTEDNSLTGVR